MNVSGPLSIPRMLPPVDRPEERPAASSTRARGGHPQAQPAGPSDAQGAFWELLTPAEREFFTQQGALGPLSYGPRAARRDPAPGPLGQRVDLRG